MFDILCDVWSRPGASHSPIVPLDLSGLSVDELTERISLLHKCGLDALLLTCRDGGLEEGLLDAAFSAAAKRFMLVFIDEGVIEHDMGCTSEVLRAYNPMLRAHLLSADVEQGSASAFGEEAARLFIKRENGVIKEAVQSADEGYEEFTLTLADSPVGIDLLSPETVEMTLSLYEAFYEKYSAYCGKAFVGIMTYSLKDTVNGGYLWSYDMMEDFFANGGDELMLASLVAETDKRSKKEGARVYYKTVADRLDRLYLKPLSDWCGKHSLALMGESPVELAGACARRLTLPVYSDDCYADVADDLAKKGIVVKCLGDTARNEGFTGVVYRSGASDLRSLFDEARSACASSAVMVLLPEWLSSPAGIDRTGLSHSELKGLMTEIRRMSTVNSSCKDEADCVVLYDDGFIPIQAAEKLRAEGKAYVFMSVSQGMERGHSHHGEFLIDRFRFTSMLIEPRVRLEPDAVRHLGEFAAYGGQLYRGSQFGDFARKHLKVSEHEKELSRTLSVRRTTKCGNDFVFLYNEGNEPVVVKYPFDYKGRTYLLDASRGTRSILPRLGDTEYFADIRLHAGASVTLATDRSALPDVKGKESEAVREIHALGLGENKLCFTYHDASRAVIELDGFEGEALAVTVNAGETRRIAARPYSLDVSGNMCDGENTVVISECSSVSGAVLRIY